MFTLHCSIFKMLFAAVSDSFNIISQVLKFVKHFFQNFLISFIAVFRFPTNSHSVSFQQLYHSIIKFLVCQVLFLKFFQLLSFTRFHSLSRVLSYYITSPPLCQHLCLYNDLTFFYVFLCISTLCCILFIIYIYFIRIYFIYSALSIDVTQKE